MKQFRLLLGGAIAALLIAGTLPTALATPGGPGRTLITVHPVEWRGFGPNTTLLNGLDVALLSGTAVGAVGAGASPDLMTASSGRRMRLVEVQLCYDATAAGVTMTQFLMRVDRNETGTTKTNPVAAAVDVTARNDEACRSYPVDWVLAPGDMAAASIAVSVTDTADSFQIGRLTFVLEGTNTPT